MELKAPQYIAKLTEKEADMFLFEPIGEGGANGQEFANEIKLLNDFGVTNINVHINTGGGEVIEGQAIFSAIINSKAHVTTIIEGTVASMGAIIALAGDTIKMTEFGNLMFHAPRLDGNTEPNPNQQTAIDAMTGSLETILASRTGKNKTEVAELMNSGDVWLNPTEALAGKFIDEIITIKHLKEVKRQPKSKIAASLKMIINKETTKTNNMKNLCAYLKINEDATDDVILNAVKAIATSLETANEELKTANTAVEAKGKEVDTLKATLATFEDAKIDAEAVSLEATVDAGIEAGKIDKEKRDDVLARFKGNEEGLKLIVGDLKAVKGAAPKVSDTLVDNGDSILGDMKDKSWREIEKNSPELAGKIKSDHVDLYKKMYKAEYKIDAPVVA